MTWVAVGAPPPTAVPDNVGLGLRPMLEDFHRDKRSMRATAAKNRSIQLDSAERVVVNIHLDGKVDANIIAAQVQGAGGEVLAIDRNWRKGVISARMPLAVIEAMAGSGGVRSIMLAPRPVHHVGKVTAESNVVEQTRDANTPGVLSSTGFLGRGISIGILSDSYDTAQTYNDGQAVPRARVGVLAGDLPGAGNPNGYTQPVVVLDDDFSFGNPGDEGRGMAEIVHDIAPAAKLCFHTAGATQAIMALGIRKLRADPAALCDVIVDDILFLDEPLFSDGELAQAIDDVSTSTTLPGKRVSYFSSAGNSANYGYSSDFRFLSPADGLAANNAAGPNRVHLDQVPPSLYGGGFHNLNAAGPAFITMPVTADFAILTFQWDDPFDADAVTTDYNLLVFDADGNYLKNFSGIDRNQNTDEAIEFVLLESGAYHLVISRAVTERPMATHLRFVSVNQGSLLGPYIFTNAISMAGHSTARYSNAVAAYQYNVLPEALANYNSAQSNPPPGPYRPVLESFTSNGGLLSFYLDNDGKRLVRPIVRAKPDIAAADGVDTSFFPEPESDFDNDNFPNFFGTSAAAPTTAAIGALVLEASGGPQSLTPDQMRTILRSTAQPHDLDPFVCYASATNGAGTVQVLARGNSASATDPRFFTVIFTGNPGETLDELAIDLSNTLLAFDDDPGSGFPFTIGSNPSGVTAVATLSNFNRVLTINFTGFTAGNSFSFGIDRDFVFAQSGGNSADLLAGGEIKAQMDSVPARRLGAFTNRIGAGYTYADGYGMVDARNAIKSIVRPTASPSGVATYFGARGSVTPTAAVSAGFVTRGSASKNIIARAIGPSFAGFAPNPLPDPTLSLYNANGTLIAFDDNWQDNSAQAAQIQAHHLAPANPAESAIFRTVTPGAYTAIVRGKSGASGTARAEIYDLDTPPPATELSILAGRANVGIGSDVLSGGFRIATSHSANILLRGVGPSLSSTPNPSFLADPVLTLYNAQGVRLASNDNWQQDSLQTTTIAATGLAPANGLESAINLTLAPGAYTAVLSGGNGATGNGLLQVFHLNQ